MKTKLMAVAAAFALTLFASASGFAGDRITNADVLKLVDAKLPVSTIVLTIKSSEADFDTSAEAIIALSKRKVPEAVIAAMLEKGGAAGATAADAAPADAFNPEQIVLVDGSTESKLRYIHSNSRTAARALGFGGVATYAVLHGPKAALQLKTNTPSFIVAVPGNAQPQSYLTLARFEPRRNGTREVMVGGGYVSYSTGIHPDRIIATQAEQIPDQSKAPKGYVLFRLTPSAALKPGEYALVTYNSQVHVAGFFLGGGDSYFDFGVGG